MIPNYKKIYTDLLDKKYPEKKQLCESILNKPIIESLDVIRLNELIFNKKSKDLLKKNQSFKAYDKDTVINILKYQKEHGLNNIQLASHFKLSRNTVAKWKKEQIFCEA
ncbi:helix-turn-helix domain-containing protein [Paenimyroides baculatum]|uniref:Helix-turn-helix domain-containing protein n=1 Tax=Paenimyroides baculatum TaxID=2608000 RepID=A0A5M6CKQ2_9FLAO|nr:helix-turn-helix domain-containing protein [Paenimyroides baculatum]KAA5535788.1 helix-turn-helix domain-containing protein [Paenimyroides baculatum]